MYGKGTEGVVGLTMFLLLSSNISRKAGPICARAFSTTTAAFTHRSSASRNTCSSRNEMASFLLHDSQSKCYSTTSSLHAGMVDQDLDAALDDLLEGTFDMIDDIDNDKTVDDFISAVDVESVKDEGPIDYTDPKFLSTSNPRWIAAGLDQRVIDVLSGKGIIRFTPVQGEAFDPIVAGRDVIGRSRTGTGKTLAFGLPSMTRLVKWMEEKGIRDPATGRMQRGRGVSMVVLCPTRELARQVQQELAEVSKPLGLFSEVFHGGVSYDPQSRALRNGLDILVGTPGRVIDHLNRGTLRLNECDSIVLDEADEMLSMGFADDVETILDGLGIDNGKKPQCLLFSATTPPWVKQIGRQYQRDVKSIDATGDDGGLRVANTVRHTAIQCPWGIESKRAILEDIIAIEISKDMKGVAEIFSEDSDSDDDEPINEIAAAAIAKKKSESSAVQQKIFGKTIVFTETKRQADELVSGGVFKSLTAQALHGDVGQKQRDATLAAFRAGAFNVLVATDVAARGIDIKNVDLVVQFDPPRDVDTYVHRSGRTGRAGTNGVSVLMFSANQQGDIVRIERDLGHGFQFELSGPPSTTSVLKAAAKTSAVASMEIPDETAEYFKESAAALLENGDAEDIVARCLAAISKRTSKAESRSLLTGEAGLVTLEMSNSRGRPVSAGDVMFTVGKLARMSQREGDDVSFESDVGKIQANHEQGICIFDMGVDEAKKLVDFCEGVEAGGAAIRILEELEVKGGYDRGGCGGYNKNSGGYGSGGGNGGGRGYRREQRNFSHDQSVTIEELLFCCQQNF
uniref:RNA helicase n=1 Tax=Pseudo-nitzschia australis TaxID=44445 RepID=A0A7S4ARI6_9STRA